MDRKKADSISLVLSCSRLPGTKASLFVPLGAAATPQQTYRTLRQVAEKLYAESGEPTPLWPEIDWDAYRKQRVATLCIYHSAQGDQFVALGYSLQPRVVVADSFHIKPLLMADLYDSQALVLHFNTSGASLTRVGLHDEEVIERYVPGARALASDWPYRLERQKVRDFMAFVRADVRNHISGRTKFLAVSSADHPVFKIKDFWESLGAPVLLTNDSFTREMPTTSCDIARLRLKREIDRVNAASSVAGEKARIFGADDGQLSELVSLLQEQSIRRIIVSADDVVFGSFDPQGAVRVHRAQKNAEDDDVLDDIAELALARGVSVQVVPKRFMPAGAKAIVG